MRYKLDTQTKTTVTRISSKEDTRIKFPTTLLIVVGVPSHVTNDVDVSVTTDRNNVDGGIPTSALTLRSASPTHRSWPSTRSM